METLLDIHELVTVVVANITSVCAYLRLRNSTLLFPQKLGCTLCQGLCLMSRLSTVGVCFRKMLISSPNFFSWFQLKSRYFNLLRPLMPSRVITWLWLASKYSRFGCKAVLNSRTISERDRQETV